MTPERVDKIATGILLGLAGIVGLVILSLLGYILAQGIPHISWHFLTSGAESFTAGGGIRDQLFNSLYLVVLTMLVSVPSPSARRFTSVSTPRITGAPACSGWRLKS